jgi:hypothetical protein
MNEDELSEQIRKIILKNLEEAFDDFDNYLFKEKYKDMELKEKFYPTTEDFEVRDKLLDNYFQQAQKKILEIGLQAKDCMAELCEEADPIIREWAKEILRKL